jgi:hypothetical protein
MEDVANLSPFRQTLESPPEFPTVGATACRLGRPGKIRRGILGTVPACKGSAVSLTNMHVTTTMTTPVALGMCKKVLHNHSKHPNLVGQPRARFNGVVKVWCSARAPERCPIDTPYGYAGSYTRCRDDKNREHTRGTQSFASQGRCGERCTRRCCTLGTSRRRSTRACETDRSCTPQECQVSRVVWSAVQCVPVAVSKYVLDVQAAHGAVARGTWCRGSLTGEESRTDLPFYRDPAANACTPCPSRPGCGDRGKTPRGNTVESS